MSIYVTGDTHGKTALAGHTNTFDRFGECNLIRCGIDPKDLSSDDIIFVAGDAGWCWDGGERDRRLLDFLQARSEELGGVKLAAIDGNHDCFEEYERFPTVGFFGGGAHRLRENVFHVPRGEVLRIGGKTVFCLGGAQSADGDSRTPGKDWWPEEELSWEQEQRAKRNLDAVGWKVDVVITHTAPVSMVRAGCFARPHAEDSVSVVLQTEFYKRLEYGLWVFGHFHEIEKERAKLLKEAYRAMMLFDDVVLIG